MDRDYNDGKKNDVIFFTGREIEKTPAYDKETLFVVGIQPVEDILKIVNRTNIDHVYLGANQSFKLTGDMGTDDEQEGWDSMVHTLLIGGMRILERILTVAFVVVESKAATSVDILILKISLHVSYAVFAVKNLMMLLLWTVKIISLFTSSSFTIYFKKFF